MKVLVFNPELCNGCRECEKVCSQTWFKVENAEKSAIRISEMAGQPGRYQAVVCNQCGECMDVCPTIALVRDRQGIVRIKKALCVGCLSCVGFCPTEAMLMHADDIVPFKCIACGKCVKVCSVGALAIEELPDPALTETETRLAAQAKAVA
jgi:carbon-monoxide dehydrogenase iron sulfur subunit